MSATGQLVVPVRRRGGRVAVGTAVAGTVFIAAGAFWLSFTALADLARRSGIDASQAWAWPLIVDGIIVVATVSVVALSRFGPRATWYPWMLLMAGTAVSVVANVSHSAFIADIQVPGLVAGAVAAVPPLVLLAMTHLTVILLRPVPETAPAAESVAAVEPVVGVDSVAAEVTAAGQAVAQIAPTRPAVDPGSSDAGVGVPARDELDRRAVAFGLRDQEWSNKAIARHLGVHPSTVGRWFAAVPAAPPTDDPVPDDAEPDSPVPAGGQEEAA
jgi:hypothetical protein